MKKKKAGRVLLSFLLTLAMVIGFMPGMCMTAHADNTEELLTTLTFGGSSTYSETKSGVVSVTATNVTSYSDAYGWLFFDVGSLSVTAEEGYTINKCVFRQNNKQPITDTEAPFEIHSSDRGCITEDTKWDMDGVTSIEVYGYVTPTTVDVTGVSLNKTTTTLTVGDTETLTATVSPDGATDKTVTWSSDNTNVATVDPNGLVTAVGAGNANITVTTTDGSKTASCAVTVNAATVTSAVTLHANGGTINSGNITEYTEGTGATLPTDVTKDGHQFGGWYDNAGLTGSPVTAISTSDTGNKEYWAKWTANPSSVSYSVVFKVVNGSWDDGNTSDKSITLSGVEGDTLKLSSGQIPAVGTKPNDGYKAGSWDVTPSAETEITEATTYTYTYAQKDSISQTVTFKVVNGKWDDDSTADKTVTLTGYEGDTLKLAANQIPAVGTKPNDTYKAGSWDTTPSVSIAITGDTAYTYTYAPKDGISSTVTFKVVNGQWTDGTTDDKVVTLTGHEGDILKLSSGQIPAVGTKPNDGYKAGSWDVTPSTDTAISSNVTYTYTYVADSSGGSSDSGSGDSSGGSSDSGSGDSSGGSSDSGSGSSSSGSTDSGSGSSSSSGSSDSGNTSGGTSSGSSDNTNTNTDTSAKVPYDDVAISTGSVNDITGTASATAESNPFGTKIENNSNLTTLLSLTDAEVAQGVNVWLDIQDMSASVSKTDKSLIQDKSGDYTVGLYLDINLFKKVGGNDATKVTETNGKVKASIVIPESLWKSGRTFEIIRVHDGVATAIAGTYDENTHVFTFETDKFSTYALAYKDPASSSNSGTTSNSSSSNSSNSTQSTAPKTGDPNDIRVWYLLLIASFGGLGFLGLSKKKEN